MKRPRPAPLSVFAAALVCGLCAGCTERQLISHPGFDDGVDSASTGVEPGGDDVPRLGNFPEPAMTECGGLPAGVDPIPGLATSWAVMGHTPGLGSEGEPYPTDLVRLRFSDFGAGCDEAFTPVIESCVDAWTFGFSVSLQNLTPGVYEMAALSHLNPELEVSMTVDDGCAGGEVGGGGAAPGAERQGQLEIFTLTDECVVGELRGLYDTYGDLDVDRNGGFVAMRCQSDCVPMLGNGCGE